MAPLGHSPASQSSWHGGGCQVVGTSVCFILLPMDTLISAGTKGTVVSGGTAEHSHQGGEGGGPRCTIGEVELELVGAGGDMALQLGPGHPVRGVEGAGGQRAGHLRVVLGGARRSKRRWVAGGGSASEMADPWSPSGPQSWSPVGHRPSPQQVSDLAPATSSPQAPQTPTPTPSSPQAPTDPNPDP